MRAILWVLVIELMLCTVVSTAAAVVLSVALLWRGERRPPWTLPLAWCRGLAVVSLVLVGLGVGVHLYADGDDPEAEERSTVEVTTAGGSPDGAPTVTVVDSTTSTAGESGTDRGPTRAVLILPVLAAGSGVAIRGRWERAVRVGCGWALFAWIAAFTSLGLVLLPAAAVLTIAGALTPSSTPRDLPELR